MQIIKRELTNVGNEKGTVYGVMNKHFGSYGFAIFYRESGTKGGHFHKGDDKSYDPQRIIMLQGKMKLRFTNLDGEVEEAIIEVGDYLEVPKMVFHEYECLEDCILLESREQEYNTNNADSHSEEEFNSLK